MALIVKLLDGNTMNIVDNVARLEIALDVTGYAKITDVVSGRTIHLERQLDGQIIEIEKPTLH